MTYTEILNRENKNPDFIYVQEEPASVTFPPELTTTQKLGFIWNSTIDYIKGISIWKVVRRATASFFALFGIDLLVAVTMSAITKSTFVSLFWIANYSFFTWQTFMFVGWIVAICTLVFYLLW